MSEGKPLFVIDFANKRYEAAGKVVTKEQFEAGFKAVVEKIMDAPVESVEVVDIGAKPPDSAGESHG